ncbi:methyltransferase, FkbM family [Pseudobutyrivibrio sp. C4]|uniref:FkbM family methyltransferase n=1 Tax=Pseudobutyrivibrio sp. C4 TaxID=1520803 RepID=UPI0008BAD524|nr:FkbM family methyltransferase [Pseudobutyrivibrio sp. C4]SET12465.1 methyltransferase, FkbM family [Pseudobutyrivibrio sp. C4]
MKIFLFGAGEFGRSYLLNNGADFECYIDNKSEKYKDGIGGKQVLSFSEFENFLKKYDIKKEEFKIVVTSSYRDEITQQIAKAGMLSNISGYYDGEKVVSYKDSFACKSYSQFGEEFGIVAYQVMTKTIDKKDGFFVDIGCHHPYAHSNTAYLHNKGWRGINIDANPNSIELFKIHRPNDINLNCGIGDKEDTLKFYRFKDSLRDSFEAERIDSNELKDIIDIPVHTLDYVLETNGIEHVDFIDIDAEGFDEKIALSFNWKKYNPYIVLVEYSGGIEKLIDSDLHKKCEKKAISYLATMCSQLCM